MQLRLARNISGNKKSFQGYMSGKRLNKESMRPWLNVMIDLETVGTDKAELSAFFSLYSCGLSGFYAW